MYTKNHIIEKIVTLTEIGVGLFTEVPGLRPGLYCILTTALQLITKAANVNSALNYKYNYLLELLKIITIL